MGFDLSNPSPGMIGAFGGIPAAVDGYMAGDKQAISMADMQAALMAKQYQNNLNMALLPLTSANAIDTMIKNTPTRDAQVIANGAALAKNAAANDQASLGANGMMLTGDPLVTKVLLGTVAGIIARKKTNKEDTTEMQSIYDSIKSSHDGAAPTVVTPGAGAPPQPTRMPQSVQSEDQRRQAIMRAAIAGIQAQQAQAGQPAAVQPQLASPQAAPDQGDLSPINITLPPGANIPAVNNSPAPGYNFSNVNDALRWRQDQLAKNGPMTADTQQALSGLDQITMTTLARLAATQGSNQLGMAKIVNDREARFQQTLSDLIKASAMDNRPPPTGRGGGKPKEDPNNAAIRTEVNAAIAKYNDPMSMANLMSPPSTPGGIQRAKMLLSRMESSPGVPLQGLERLYNSTKSTLIQAGVPEAALGGNPSGGQDPRALLKAKLQQQQSK